MTDESRKSNDETKPVLAYRSPIAPLRSKYEMGPIEQRIQILLAVGFLVAIVLLVLVVVSFLKNGL